MNPTVPSLPILLHVDELRYLFLVSQGGGAGLSRKAEGLKFRSESGAFGSGHCRFPRARSAIAAGNIPPLSAKTASIRRLRVAASKPLNGKF